MPSIVKTHKILVTIGYLIMATLSPRDVGTKYSLVAPNVAHAEMLIEAIVSVSMYMRE